MKCPKCRKGKIAINFSEGGKKWEMEIQCIYCDGKGEISEAQAKEIEDEKALWCNCEGDQSEDAIFWDDGEHPKCSKHCWTCRKCGKIVQVG